MYWIRKDHIDITVQENELKVVGDKESKSKELEMVMQFILVLNQNGQEIYSCR